MDRKQRKLEHLKYFAEMDETPGSSGFSDVSLVYQTVSGVDLSQVDISADFLGKSLEAPLLINAITGGHPDTLKINKALAIAAKKTGVAMAVGSQKAALEDERVRDTFLIAREQNPDGVLLANLSAACHFEEAAEAVSMIKADGLQVHFNMPQELFMAEGDWDFSNILSNVKKLTQKAHFPVIAKEVGFGMSRESILTLYRAGITMFDIGGKGGTNFISIENARSGHQGGPFKNWGIPTAISLYEGMDLGLPVKFIASGGLTDALDMAKALASGAKMTALAGPFLRVLSQGSVQGLVDYIEGLKKGLAKCMAMVGAGNIIELSRVPLVITGQTAAWLNRRGVDIDAYARRNF